MKTRRLEACDGFYSKLDSLRLRGPDWPTAKGLGLEAGGTSARPHRVKADYRQKP